MSYLRGVVWSRRARIFFFFQAEDGIRDVAVTGVQTCALPIFGPAAREVEPRRRDRVKLAGQVPPSHGATCHSATVGSSPRISIRTPCTRRFIPVAPRD